MMSINKLQGAHKDGIHRNYVNNNTDTQIHTLQRVHFNFEKRP